MGKGEVEKSMTCFAMLLEAGLVRTSWGLNASVSVCEALMLRQMPDFRFSIGG